MSNIKKPQLDFLLLKSTLIATSAKNTAMKSRIMNDGHNMYHYTFFSPQSHYRIATTAKNTTMKRSYRKYLLLQGGWWLNPKSLSLRQNTNVHYPEATRWESLTPRRYLEAISIRCARYLSCTIMPSNHKNILRCISLRRMFCSRKNDLVKAKGVYYSRHVATPARNILTDFQPV